MVAESVRPGVDLFMGQHYPASDIPAQARKLYLRNIFRIIANVRAVPVPILPTLDGKGMALDQSLSVLRAVSPIHIEYLRNMGVGCLALDFHHSGRKIVGHAGLPSLQSAPAQLCLSNGGRTVRPDVLADAGKPRAAGIGRL